MRTLAHSPRYWEKLPRRCCRNPLARLVDLLVIKQGERIAHQKGWKLADGPRRRPPRPRLRRQASQDEPGRPPTDADGRSGLRLIEVLSRSPSMSW